MMTITMTVVVVIYLCLCMVNQHLTMTTCVWNLMQQVSCITFSSYTKSWINYSANVTHVDFTAIRQSFCNKLIQNFTASPRASHPERIHKMTAERSNAFVLCLLGKKLYISARLSQNPKGTKYSLSSASLVRSARQ
jgi:hypothetical protein